MANYVPAVDYTSRDYSSLLSDMLGLLPAFTNNKWTTTNTNDVATILIELFAYMGDIMSYYIDRSANEAFINTATQRQSLLDISALLGYVPTLATPASGTVTFQNGSSSSITVPALTQVSTSLVNNATTTQIIFETTSSVTVPASSASITLSSVSGIPASSSTSVTGTSGTTTLTVTSPTSPIVAGMFVTGTGVATNAYVVSVTGSGPYTVTLSSALTLAASGTYNFTAVAQYTSVTSHGLTTGQSVSITGYGIDGYNVSGQTVVVTSTTTFTIVNSTVGVTTGTGTLTYATTGGVNSASVSVVQGQTVSNEIIGTSSGQPFQVYQLANTSVINGSISIVINGVTYGAVPYLVDYGSLDPVFSTVTDETGITYIKFGDGASGRIPPANAQIYATYRVGGGVIGNVGASLIKYILSLPGYSAVPSGLSLDYGKSTATSGGADAESNDSIRYNAPLALRTLNRAITVNDHSSLATQVVGVAKASAKASNYSAITVYVLPSGDTGVSVGSSGDNTTQTAGFIKKASDVSNYVKDKVSPSATITVQPPSWVGCYLEANIVVYPTYNQSSVKTSVINTLQNLYYVDNVSFGQTVSLANLYTAINSVPGVQSSKIIKHVRADQDQTYTTTTKAITSGIATLGLNTSTNSIAVGQTIRITGVDTTFNGVYNVTAVTTNSISYALSAANVTSTAVITGTVTVLSINDVTTAVNELPTLFYAGTTPGASLTTTGANSTPWIGSLVINASGGIV